MKLPSTISLSQLHLQWKSLDQNTKKATLAHLDELQKQPWSKLTSVQKKAIYYSQFGAHGKRTELPKGHYMKVFLGTMGILGLAGIISMGIQSTYTLPETMTNPEWAEKQKDYAIVQNADPINKSNK